ATKYIEAPAALTSVIASARDGSETNRRTVACTTAQVASSQATKNARAPVSPSASWIQAIAASNSQPCTAQGRPAAVNENGSVVGIVPDSRIRCPVRKCQK